MFREGRHVQENKRRCEKLYLIFPYLFLVFFLLKIEASEKVLCAQKSTTNPRLERVFPPTSRFLVDPWGPSGSPGASRDVREPPRSLFFSINFQLCLKIGPDRLPGGPRKAPAFPQAPPGLHFGLILYRFFWSICLSRDGSGTVFWTLR